MGMHMYSTYVQYVRSRCMPFSSAGGGSMDMEEWQGEEDISGCLKEKGRAILQSNPAQHAVKKGGKREILERERDCQPRLL